MKYELINPSDAIYFEGDFEPAVMGAAIAFLGNGKYGLDDSNGNQVVPIWLFGGHEEWFRAHETTLDDVLTKKRADVAAFLDTLTYAGERSSLNNIGARAKAIAEALRK